MKLEKENLIQKAAIAALPECIRTCNEILMRGGRLECNSITEQVAKLAVDYAKALTDKLIENKEK